MKSHYVLLSIIVMLFSVSHSVSFAQNYCSTSSNYPNHLEAVNLTNYNVGNCYTINVQVHVVSNDDGSGGRNDLEIDEGLELLTNFFAPSNILFHFEPIDRINSSHFNTDFDNNKFNELITTNNNPNALNIYVLGINTWNQGRASGIPGNSCVVGGRVLNTDCFISNILAHEVGHCLGLFHTHHGNIEGNCDELVNGSNCQDCGDFVCDTPADPLLNFNVDPVNCTWDDLGLVDVNGDLFNPDTRNVMSYSFPTCLNNISIGQITRIRQSIETSVLLQDILYNPIIQGAEIVCASGFTQFEIDLPNETSVTWSATGPVSINPNTGVATAIGNGNATIIADVSGPCGNVQFTKTVKVGLPPLINSVSFFNGIGEEFYFCTSHIGNYLEFEPFDSDATYRYRVLSWPNLQVLYTSPSTYNSNQIFVNWVPFPNPAPYFYVIEIQATNACGSTDWTGQGGWEVEFLDCSSPGGGWFMMSYPNPSDDELIVEAAQSDELEGTSAGTSQNKSSTSGQSLADIEAVLVLLNEAQEVVWQGSLKAGRASINTSSLPEGTYYLRLTHEGETLTRRVWVRH